MCDHWSVKKPNEKLNILYASLELSFWTNQENNLIKWIKEFIPCLNILDWGIFKFLLEIILFGHNVKGLVFIKKMKKSEQPDIFFLS